GIRDKLVTGVQTCALPISFHLLLLFLLSSRVTRHFQVPSRMVANLPLYFQAVAGCSPRNPFLFMFLHVAGGWVGASPEGLLPSEIGRASCRERVSLLEVTG